MPLLPFRQPALPTFWVLTSVLGLAACGGLPQHPAINRTPQADSGIARPPASTPSPAKPVTAPTSRRGGGYYLDDGPGEETPSPERLAAIADAVPKYEPLHRFANRPYSVFNREYVPLAAAGTYKAQGIGSWYGRKFHGQRTSNGEVYDMFAMTAAHPTLPLPSYARVTNPANGKSVVVRVNDRGPFHSGRIIDLSYVAAWKLGYVGNGSTLPAVESLSADAATSMLPATSTQPTTPTLAAIEPARGDPLGELIQRVDQQTLPPVAQTAGVLPEVKESRGIFLQLGAFGNPENAESFKAHLGRELTVSGAGNAEENVDLSSKLRVQSRAGLYRVQLGPWPDPPAAQRAAERLREMFDIKPMMVRQ